MSTRLCLWFGHISGAFVGLLLGFLHGVVCCTPPQIPTWAQLALDGIIVGLIAVCISAAFACLLSRLKILPVFVLAIIIGVLAGILFGPLAYHIPHPLLAMLICGILGAILGWLVCLLVCRGMWRPSNVEASR